MAERDNWGEGEEADGGFGGVTAGIVSKAAREEIRAGPGGRWVRTFLGTFSSSVRVRKSLSRESRRRSVWRRDV